MDDMCDHGCRVGAKGQALLLRDVHTALLRVLESADDELLPPPAAALPIAPPELGPHDAYRCVFFWCARQIPAATGVDIVESKRES